MRDMNALIQRINPQDITADYCMNFHQQNGNTLEKKEREALEHQIRNYHSADGDTVLKAIIVYALFDPASALKFARQKGVFCYANSWPHTTYCLQQLNSLLNVLEIPKKEQCFIRQKLQCSWLKSFYETTEKRIKRMFHTHHKQRLREKIGLQSVETNLIVELLAYINYYFRYRDNRNNLPKQQLEQDKLASYSIEELSEAVSYLIYLYNAEVLTTADKHLWMDVDYLMGNEIQNLICLACQRNFVQEWETEADYLQYCFDNSKNCLTILDPEELLEKSLMAGFIRTENDERHLVNEVFTQNQKSLALSALKLVADYGSQIFQWKEDSTIYKRYRMEIPVSLLEPFIPENFTNPGLYMEEQAQLEFAARERMLTTEQFCNQQISEHCTFMDLLLFKRFFTLLVYTQRWLFHQEKDTRKIIVSIVPVMPEVQLQNIICRFVGSYQKTVELIEHFTWDGKEKLDLQYTPIVKISSQQLYISPDILANSNVLRNSVLLERMRNNKLVNTDGKNDALEAFCQESFKRCSYQFGTCANIEYQYQDRNGQIDFLAWSDNNIFVFECKNTIIPTSAHEIRTTYEHIQKASRQLDLVIEAMGDEAFQNLYFPRWNIPLKEYSIHTCILLGNRLFTMPNGMRHPVRYAYDLDFVLNKGIIQNEFGQWNCWTNEKFTGNDLVRFLSNEDSFLNCFVDAMKPHSKRFHCQGKTVQLQSYCLDQCMLIQKLDATLRANRANSETPNN